MLEIVLHFTGIRGDLGRHCRYDVTLDLEELDEASDTSVVGQLCFFVIMSG
jgi:hypothetical protein